MKSNKNLFNAIGVLAIGAILTGGGLFLWQNQFNFIFAPQAATKNVQAVVVIGEKDTNEISELGKSVVAKLNETSPKKIELIDRSETGTAVSTLRDQSVLGFNDITKPITGHVYFIATVGESDFTQGVTNKEAVSVISSRFSRNLSNLIDILTSRPGAFPDGVSVYIAMFPDPTAGSGDVSVCKGVIPNNGKEYTRSVYSEMTKSLAALKSVYPQYLHIVNANASFSDHGLSSSQSWFDSCTKISQVGSQQLNNAFTAELGK